MVLLSGKLRQPKEHFISITRRFLRRTWAVFRPLTAKKYGLHTLRKKGRIPCFWSKFFYVVSACHSFFWGAAPQTTAEDMMAPCPPGSAPFG